MTLSGIRSAVLVTSLLVAGTFGCTSESAPSNDSALVFSDFDQFTGWMPENPSLTSEVAHSGRFSIKAGGDVEYSLTYSRPLGLISAKRFHKVKLSAWVYLADAGAGTVQLTVALHDPAHDHQQVFSQGELLNNQVKEERQWKQISKEITLPANADFGHEMRIFLWKAGAGSPAYLDDLKVEAVE